MRGLGGCSYFLLNWAELWLPLPGQCNWFASSCARGTNQFDGSRKPFTALCCRRRCCCWLLQQVAATLNCRTLFGLWATPTQRGGGLARDISLAEGNERELGERVWGNLGAGEGVLRTERINNNLFPSWWQGYGGAGAGRGNIPQILQPQQPRQRRWQNWNNAADSNEKGECLRGGTGRHNKLQQQAQKYSYS